MEDLAGAHERVTLKCLKEKEKIIFVIFVYICLLKKLPFYLQVKQWGKLYVATWLHCKTPKCIYRKCLFHLSLTFFSKVWVFNVIWGTLRVACSAISKCHTMPSALIKCCLLWVTLCRNETQTRSLANPTDKRRRSNEAGRAESLNDPKKHTQIWKKRCNLKTRQEVMVDEDREWWTDVATTHH